MATRKQRRRREKEQRHEYELVEIDDEGNETVLSAPSTRSENGSKKPTRASTSTKQPGRGRGRGPLPAPTWRRVLKRGALFSPVFFATVLLLNGDRGYGVALTNTVLLVAVFIPFSYFMDRVMYRAQQKRLTKTSGG